MAAFSEPADLTQFLLTETEIENIYDEDIYSQYTFDIDGGKIIQTKVESFKPEINHKINNKTYDTVYVTSDIHSDLRKFIQILINNNLIETNIHPYHGDDIYNPKLITETKWIGGSRVLLVIIGDIVDGKRLRRLDDSRGSFEYLLHCFLYNIRIKAKQTGSDVLFTLGNHDVDSVIITTDFNNLYQNYVTDDAKRFFLGTHTDRRNSLLPFYYKSPYLCLQLVNDSDITEIICVHAGIRNRSGDSVLAQLNDVQNKIMNTPQDMANIIQTNYSKFVSSIWDRYYTQMPNVHRIKQEKDPLTIIGHCPTHSQGADTPYLSFKMKNSVYDGCQREPDCGKDRGCVFLNYGLDNVPQFILVDTGLSEGFRYSTEEYTTGYCKDKQPMFHNSMRDVEILKLSHNESAPVSSIFPIYFNKIERQLNGIAHSFDKPVSSNVSTPVTSSSIPPPSLPTSPTPITTPPSSTIEDDDDDGFPYNGGTTRPKIITGRTSKRKIKKSKKRKHIKRKQTKKQKG